jgi:hypothetical protein
MGDFLDGLIIGIIVFSGISGILIAAITSDEYNKVICNKYQPPILCR